MMEVALRVRLHGGIHSDGVQGMDGSVSQSEEASIKESKAAATELLEALEAKVGSSAVLGRYADIQRMLQASKAEKKRALASEAVKDPKAYAVRKVTHTHGDMYTHTHTNTYTHTYTHTCTHMYTPALIHIYTHTYIHIHAHIDRYLLKLTDRLTD